MKIGLEKVRILTKLKAIQPGQEQEPKCSSSPHHIYTHNNFVLDVEIKHRIMTVFSTAKIVYFNQMKIGKKSKSAEIEGSANRRVN